MANSAVFSRSPVKGFIAMNPQIKLSCFRQQFFQGFITHKIKWELDSFELLNFN